MEKSRQNRILWKAEKKRKAMGWGIAFGWDGDEEYLFSWMMWDQKPWLESL